MKSKIKNLKTEIKLKRHIGTSVCKMKTGKKLSSLKSMVQNATEIIICYFI